MASMKVRSRRDGAAGRAVARPKLRSRKGGAAVPLDETDKRLMNLLQSSFPLEPRPYCPSHLATSFAW